MWENEGNAEKSWMANYSGDMHRATMLQCCKKVDVACIYAQIPTKTTNLRDGRSSYLDILLSSYSRIDNLVSLHGHKCLFCGLAIFAT
jgi:hypothetical protein